MKRCEWEERIALLVDGELDAAAERHADECTECGELLTILREQQSELRAQPVLPYYAIPAVRARVMAEVAAPRRSWMWGWAAVPVLAGLAVLGLVRQQPMPVEPVPLPKAPPVAAVVTPPVVTKKAHIVRRKPVREALSPELERRLAELMKPRKQERSGASNAAYVARTKDPDVIIALVPPTIQGEPNDE